jgi:SulP family sulfate permease
MGGIVLILGAKRFNRSIPGPLIAVIFGVLITSLAGLDALGVRIVGEVPSGLPAFRLPAFSLDSFQALLPIALAISLVGFMESIAVAKAIQAKHKNYKIDANQELIGLGMANVAGSMFQAFPTTGGFSRTAVNDQAGAQTGMASILSAGLIAVTLLFLTPLFHDLPKAILASVIMVAVFGLIDVAEVGRLWKTDRRDFAALIVTFVATLALGIEQGILFGVALSLGLVIYQTTRPHFAVLGRLPGTKIWRNVERFPEVETQDDVLVVRPDARLYFANVAYVRDRVEAEIDRRGDVLRHIVVDSSSIGSVDSSAVHMIHDLVEEMKERGMDFRFVGLVGPVRDAFERHGLFESIGESHFHVRICDAVSALHGTSTASGEAYPNDPTLQTGIRSRGKRGTGASGTSSHKPAVSEKETH